MNLPYTILILGGSSAIAATYARRRVARLIAEGEKVRLILAGRSVEKLEATADDLRARGAEVQVATRDLNQFDAALLHGPIDEAVFAYSTLTDQATAQASATYLAAQMTLNLTSIIVWLEGVAKVFEDQGHGRALVIGSVAGDRGRMSNYAYGAAKAGLATFVAGMAHRFSKQRHIVFTLLKPGLVDTPMTAHIEPKGALWAGSERVAACAERALLAGRNVAYTPSFWRMIMLAIKLTPTFIFHRTKL